MAVFVEYLVDAADYLWVGLDVGGEGVEVRVNGYGVFLVGCGAEEGDDVVDGEQGALKVE